MRALTHVFRSSRDIGVNCRNEVLAREGIDTHTIPGVPRICHLRRNEVLAREGIDTAVNLINARHFV